MIRSTFAGFTTAQLGMMASQRALDVTGQNIANANTEGYTRQVADFSSLHMGDGMELYASRYDTKIGNGVILTGISQIRDPYLDRRFRTEIAQVGNFDTKVTTLEGLQSIFDEIADVDGTNGIHNNLLSILTALENLSGQVGNKEFENMIRSNCSVFVNTLNQYGNALANYKRDLENDLVKQDMVEVNNILNQIQELNKTIQNNEMHGSPSLELKDQRNLLLDDLATYINIEVSYKPIDMGNGVVINELHVTTEGLDGEDYTLIDGVQPAAQIDISKLADTGNMELVLRLSKESNVYENFSSIGNLTEDKMDDINETLSSIQNLNKEIEDAALAGKNINNLVSQRTNLVNTLQGLIPNIQVESPSTKVDLGNGVIVDRLNITLTGDDGENYTLINGSNPAAQIAMNKSHITGEDVETINKTSSEIQNLNQQIQDALKAGTSVTGLKAQRDSLVENLKNLIPNLNVENGATDDQLKITTMGRDGNEYTLVDGVNPTPKFSSTKNYLPTKNVFTLKSEIQNDMTDNVMTGSLRGSLDMLNKSSEFDDNPSGIRGINYYINMFDKLANKFAVEMNNLNQRYAYENGKLNEGKLERHDLFESTDGKPITASTIKISDAWQNGSESITTSKSQNDPNNGTGDNTNVLSFINLFNSKMDFKTNLYNQTTNPYDTDTDNRVKETGTQIFNGTFEEFFVNINSMLGHDLQSANSSLQNFTTVAADIQDSRDNLSAVSLDEEGINLLRYQKSFSAAARLMTTLDEALDTIINKMGVVGR